MGHGNSKPFTATLVRPEGTGTSTRFVVPFNVEASFGSRGRVALRGTIDGHRFRGSAMPGGDGTHFVVVNKELRAEIGKEAGASVIVELELDDEPRVVMAPECLSQALERHDAAKIAFDRLSYTHRKEYVDWIEGAKQEATRERRALKTVEMLLAGKGVKGDLPSV